MNLLEIQARGSFALEVAVDMDGVLADFSAKVKEIFGKEKNNIDTKELWSGIAKYDKEVEPFFENIPMMSDAKELINFVDTTFESWYILTASGYTPKNVEEQKRRWVKKTISPLVNVEVVGRSKEKSKFAHSNAILIDDRRVSIEPWVSAGGIGVLHVSAKNTISQLKDIISEKKDM